MEKTYFWEILNQLMTKGYGSPLTPLHKGELEKSTNCTSILWLPGQTNSASILWLPPS